MSVQRSVSGSQVRAQLTSVLVLLLGIFQRPKRWKRLVPQRSGHLREEVGRHFTLFLAWGWLTSLLESRDLSLQDKASDAFSQGCPLNQLHAGARLDRHACALN